MSINQFLKQANVQTVITLLGVLVVILNLYLASKLTPISEDIRSVAGRVQAIEDYRAQTAPLVERFIISEQKLLEMQSNIVDIKSDLRDIKSALLK